MGWKGVVPVWRRALPQISDKELLKDFGILLITVLCYLFFYIVYYCIFCLFRLLFFVLWYGLRYKVVLVNWAVGESKRRRVRRRRLMLRPSPCNVDAAETLVCKLQKCRRREVQVVVFACLTSVGDSHLNALPLVLGVDFSSTQGVTVRVSTGGVLVKQFVGEGYDVVGVDIYNSTGAKSGVVVGTLAIEDVEGGRSR